MSLPKEWEADFLSGNCQWRGYGAQKVRGINWQLNK